MISRVESVGLVRALICAVLVLGCLSAANAADGKEGDDRWNIVLMPYLWGISLDGEMAIGRLPPVDVDASFGDIFSYVNFGGSLHTEFRKGKWNFVIDPTYMNLEMDAPTQDVTLPPPPLGGTAATVGGKVKVKMWFVEGWTSYLITPGLELLGGVRWQSQDLDVEVRDIDTDTPILSGNPVDKNWTDFFAGARYSTALGQKWTLNLRGDYAVAGDSESGSWNGIVMFNRRFGETMALNLGYRYFANEYKTGSGADSDRYLWDMKMSGPIVGYTWQFGGTRWPR
jgi:hypothetical protein